MRILFFPSDLGGGFGHISRCLALAQEGKQRGHQCAFVLNDTKYGNNISKDFRVYISKKGSGFLSFLSILKNSLFTKESSVAPLFTEISSLDYQVVRDGLSSEKIIENILDQYVKISKNFNPDVLIGDTNLLVRTLSQKIEVPVVQIVRFASHPKTARIIWWKNHPEEMIPPNTCDLFNHLLLL